MSSFEEAVIQRINQLEREVERLQRWERPIGRPVFLTTPKTSTSWDGDAKSSTLKTLIDLSSVFGVPAGVKAVLAQTIMRDSGSSTHNNFFILDGTDADGSGALTNTSRTLPNDTTAYAYGIVPCDANGDIYYQINASGSLTMDCWIRIWGWWL